MISYEQELQLHQVNKIPFFEGWYLRVVDKKLSIAIIIGIAKTKAKQEVFIQVFHTRSQLMEKVSYDIKELYYCQDPFMILIKKSMFKKQYLHIEDERLSTIINLEFEKPLSIKRTKYAPTIMGPFAYLKGMQCNHAIINLGSPVHGYVKCDRKLFPLDGIVYQEKDWGTSFPQKYIWVQSNQCLNKNAILFLSCATIPLPTFKFTGVIMTLLIEGKEYHFASYYGAHVIKAQIINHHYHLWIRQGAYLIKCLIKPGQTYLLEAPKDGSMVRNVEESLLGQVKIKIYKYTRCIDTLIFSHCGVENDHFFK